MRESALSKWGYSTMEEHRTRERTRRLAGLSLLRRTEQGELFVIRVHQHPTPTEYRVINVPSDLGPVTLEFVMPAYDRHRQDGQSSRIVQLGSSNLETQTHTPNTYLAPDPFTVSSFISNSGLSFPIYSSCIVSIQSGDTPRPRAEDTNAQLGQQDGISHLRSVTECQFWRSQGEVSEDGW